MTTTILDLPDALQFSADDLTANRAGRLSAPQIERLARLRRRSLLVSVGLLFALALIATIALFVGQRSGSGVLSLVGAAITVVNAAFVGISARNWLRLDGDVRGGTVAVTEGVAGHKIRMTGRVAVYVLKLNGEEINVSKSVFFAFRDGVAYRLYRAPASRILLTAETA